MGSAEMYVLKPTQVFHTVLMITAALIVILSQVKWFIFSKDNGINLKSLFTIFF